jgi:release factor glutamine methyltransferase
LKKPLKYILNLTLRPLVQRYLRKVRQYHFNGLTLTIPPGVFHPGLYFSTKFLLKYIETLPLENKTLLELGAGSGLISLSAAKRGAIVTATDINPTAVEYLEKNSSCNNIPLQQVILSDLFDTLPVQPFDIIAVNPPYYKKDPDTAASYAWYCGAQGEYFVRFFKALGSYIHADTAVLMVLCDECDIEMIQRIAAARRFGLTLVKEERKITEMNYIFRIKAL